MIVDQLFTKKLNESLADQIMQSARAAGLNPRLAAAPSQSNTARSTTVASGLINPATRKPYTRQELRDLHAAATGTFPGENPTGPNYVGRLEVKRRQAARAAQAAAAQAKPNFGTNTGYGKVNQPTSIKYTGLPGTKPAAAPAAPTTAKLPAGGGAGVKAAGANVPIKIGGQTLNPKNPADKALIDKVQAQTTKVAEALKQPVAEMLEMVETKEDVAKIKQFIDQTFIKYGAVSESAFAIRNKLIEHVTQVGAQRRREHARMS